MLLSFVSISIVLIFLIIFYKKQSDFSDFMGELRYKYKAETWHKGFFADRKLKKLLNEEDRFIFNQKAKKLDRFTLIFFLIVVLISVLNAVMKTFW